MPFTLSHPAAVLPLRRLGLPMSAMVIGSMTPDAPLFVRWEALPRVTHGVADYPFTHSLLGAVTVDLGVGLVLLGLWFLLARDPLVDLAPRVVRSRLAPRARLTARQWLLAPLGEVVGSLTHIGWDAFTHSNQWGARHIAWLRAAHGPLAGSEWLQYASSVVGLAVVLVACVVHLRALPRRADDRSVHGPLRALVLPAVVVVGVVAGAVAGLAALPHGLGSVAFHGLVAGVVTLAVGVVLVALGWRVLVREQASKEASRC